MKRRGNLSLTAHQAPRRSGFSPQKKVAASRPHSSHVRTQTQAAGAQARAAMQSSTWDAHTWG